MNGFRSDLANLNEKLKVSLKIFVELFENSAKTENQTTGVAQEITEMRLKIISLDERLTETNDRITELE